MLQSMGILGNTMQVPIAPRIASPIFFVCVYRSSGGGAAPPSSQGAPDVPTMVGVAGSMYPQINPIDKLYLMQNSYFDH